MRGIRGAICLSDDDAADMREAVATLLGEMLAGNDLMADDIISVLLTCTPDLHSAFPAAGAREFGLTDVPLLCAQEIDVAGSLARVVRVLIHAYTDRNPAEINHVYLRGAEALRPDLSK